EQRLALLPVGKAWPLKQKIVQVALCIRNLKRESAGVLDERTDAPVGQDGVQQSIGVKLAHRICRGEIEKERLIVPREVLVAVAVEDIVDDRIAGGSRVRFTDLRANGHGL